MSHCSQRQNSFTCALASRDCFRGFAAPSPACCVLRASVPVGCWPWRDSLLCHCLRGCDHVAGKCALWCETVLDGLFVADVGAQQELLRPQNLAARCGASSGETWPVEQSRSQQCDLVLLPARQHEASVSSLLHTFLRLTDFFRIHGCSLQFSLMGKKRRVSSFGYGLATQPTVILREFQRECLDMCLSDNRP